MRGVRFVLRALSDMTRFLLYTGFFTALIALVSYWVVVSYVKWEEEILMPDLHGKTLIEAHELANPARLTIKLDRQQPHPTIPEGRIISQFPQPDQLIKQGSSVRVVVSGGIDLVVVPDTLVGETRRAVGVRLRNAGLDEGNIAHLVLAGTDGGIVLATDPPSGAGVAEGSTVNLLVSAGDVMAVGRMPNVIGLTLEQARELLAAEGIRADERTEPSPGVLPGRIHQQSPNPGDLVNAASAATIIMTPPLEEEYRPRRPPPTVPQLGM